MKINTISRIEQFICDSLISSPLIPVSVNVLRLADAADKESVVSQTNNIVVRWLDSDQRVKTIMPMVYEKDIYFQLDYACQNYLTSSGHDFATQLITAAEITLTGSVPSGAYVQSLNPGFVCTSSKFTGLTEESQYTYSQIFKLTVEETVPIISLDPCVQRGDCRQIFPGSGVETKLPLGGVVYDLTGDIYIPWSESDTPGHEKGIRWSNEILQSGDWVFQCFPEEVFLEDPANNPVYIISNNNFTEDGKLVVTIWNSLTKEPIKTVFYINSGRKLARYAVELWRNVISSDRESPISVDAVKEATFVSSFNYGELAIVTGAYQLLFSDPMDTGTGKLTVTGGSLVGVRLDTFIQTPGGRFYFVPSSPQGKGWMKEGTFEPTTMSTLWRLGCLPCEGNAESPGLC